MLILFILLNFQYKKRPGGGYKFSCQHGPTECLGNIVHNCVIKYIKEPMPYIKCMMEDNYEPLEIGKKVSIAKSTFIMLLKSLVGITLATKTFF